MKKISLKTEFEDSVRPIIIYLASIYIIFCIVNDLIFVGLRLDFVLIRLFYPIFIYFFCKKVKELKIERFYELPLWAVSFYATGFLTYFAFCTTGLNSAHITGIAQLHLGMAILPISVFSFFSIYILSTLSYLLVNAFISDVAFTINSVAITALITFSSLSILIFYFTSKMRREKIVLQNQLCETLDSQEQQIITQSKIIAEGETKAALSMQAIQMAHDIKSPLASLELSTKFLSSIPEENKYIIQSALKQLNEITVDLLSKHKDSSNQNSKSLPNDNSNHVLIGNIIEEVIEHKKFQCLHNPKISFEVHLDELTSQSYVYIDALKMKRVLINIINNSVEATQPDPQVMNKIRISTLRKSDILIITIEDKGVGISEEYLETLRQDNLKATSLTKSKGNGLGLSHARETIHSFNGKLEIESKINQGCLVKIKLPVSRINV